VPTARELADDPSTKNARTARDEDPHPRPRDDHPS